MILILFIFLATLSIFLVSANLEYQREVTAQKENLRNELQILSTYVNQYVTQSIENGVGLISYIRTFPNLSREEFESYAMRLYNPEDSVIRHYTVLKDTTITYVYPYEDNKGAIGIDLAEVEAQREDTLRIKDENISMFVGPVDLVQGGRALINRMPIVIDDDYWGQLSLVIRYDKLLELSGIASFSEKNKIRIEQVQGEYIPDKTFYENAEIFSSDSIVVSFDVPNGQWELTVEPKEGFNGLTTIFTILVVLGILFSLIISYFSNLLLINNKKLNDTVQLRTNEISQANKELKVSLHQLETTQEQLVMREKHAALGELVAGVAHEINTPLGICVTVNSYVQDNNRKLKNHFESNTLKKSELVDNFNSVEESTEILASNLERVSQLVYSFKKLATDQFLDEYTSINFKTYLDYIFKTISPTFKTSKHKIILDVPDIEFMTFPSAIFQVMTNLIMNSYIHGFEQIENGEIKIHASVYNNMLMIDYYDNGQGIKEDLIDKIYNPFFTTKRNEGSTGLGMHIVYNIVFQKLQGSIELIDSNQGVHFVVQLPLSLE